MRSVYLLALLTFFACKGKPGGQGENLKDSSAIDSTNTPGSADREKFDTGKYKKNTTVSLASYTITLWTPISHTDGSVSVLIASDSHVNKTDTLFLPGELTDLKKKDSQTLQGHIWQEDEITHMPHKNYMIQVSLPAFEVQVSPPDILTLDYPTKATDTIFALRKLLDGEEIPFAILPDTKLNLDTLYGQQQLVILRVNDTIRVAVQADKIEGKIKVSL